MLINDPSTCRCCDDGGVDANVNRIVSVPARADDIDDKILFSVDYNSRDGAGIHERGSLDDDFLAQLNAGDSKTRQERADLLWKSGSGCDDVLEGEFYVCCPKVLW